MIRVRVVAASLLGLAEIAQKLGISKRTALSYTQRSDFPEPIARLASGSVWETSSVEQWAEATLPLKRGRPPAGPRAHPLEDPE